MGTLELPIAEPVKTWTAGLCAGERTFLTLLCFFMGNSSYLSASYPCLACVSGTEEGV